MKKSEMEQSFAEYHARVSTARSSLGRGEYRAALDAAVSAWERVDGMMQHARKYGSGDVDGVEAFDLALEYAPLLLDRQLLAKLETFLEANRQIVRRTSDIKTDLANARGHMWDNHRLWSYLEGHPGVRQDGLAKELGGEQEYWRTVVHGWNRMGLVRRVREGSTYRLWLVTRLGALICGKCSACGFTAEAPKAMLLEEMACPKCRKNVSFVLLPRDDVDAEEE